MITLSIYSQESRYQNNIAIFVENLQQISYIWWKYFQKEYFSHFSWYFCIFCMIINQKKSKTIKTNNFCFHIPFPETILFAQIWHIKNSVNLHFLRFWLLLAKNGYFLEILNLYVKIEKPIFIFAGKTLVIKLFNYNVFFWFLSLFFWKKHFNDVFTYQFEKKMDFLQKTCGVCIYFEIAFDINVAHLKMVYRCKPYDF